MYELWHTVHQSVPIVSYVDGTAKYLQTEGQHTHTLSPFLLLSYLSPADEEVVRSHRHETGFCKALSVVCFS